MINIKSAMAFRLLCWGIGIMAAALLGLVGLMVYSVVYGQDAPAAKAAEYKAPNKPQETPVDQLARTWNDKFWPEKTPEEGGGGPAVDSFSGYRCIGQIASSSGKGCAILQRENDSRQVIAWENETKDDVTLKKLLEDSVVVKIGQQVATLRRVDTRPMSGGQGRRTGVVMPAMGMTAPPTTSYRMAATSGAGSGGPAAPASSMAAPSRPGPGPTATATAAPPAPPPAPAVTSVAPATPPAAGNSGGYGRRGFGRQGRGQGGQRGQGDTSGGTR